MAKHLFQKGHAPLAGSGPGQSPPYFIDGSMRLSEVRQVLADLDFRRQRSVPLELDRDCRDFLLRCLQAK